MSTRQWQLTQLAGVTVTMTNFRRTVAYTVQLAPGSRERSTTEIWCPISHLTTLARRHGPWYPMGRWQSWYDRVSRVPTYQTSPRAKLESDCVDGDGTITERRSGRDRH